MKKNIYYAIYDIKEDRTRDSVVQILKNHGFTRIQKSVFCGNSSNQQNKDLIELIKGVITESDSFYLLLSCSQCFGKLTVVGKGFDKDYVSDIKSVDVF